MPKHDSPIAWPKCPVDRGKLLIALEHCRGYEGNCMDCPMKPYNGNCMMTLAEEALAYICYLEEALGI